MKSFSLDRRDAQNRDQWRMLIKGKPVKTDLPVKWRLKWCVYKGVYVTGILTICHANGTLDNNEESCVNSYTIYDTILHSNLH